MASARSSAPRLHLHASARSSLTHRGSAPRLRHQDRSSPHASAPPPDTAPWESASSSFFRAAGVFRLALVRLRSRRLKRNLFDARPLLSCFAGSAGCLRFAPVNACASRRGSPRDPPSLSGGWLGRRSAKAEPVLATCQGGNLIGLGVRPNRVESKRRWVSGAVGWASIVWP